MERDADLLEIVDAGSAAGGFADFLHRREHQRHQNANDRYHYQQFDERERGPIYHSPVGRARHNEIPQPTAQTAQGRFY